MLPISHFKSGNILWLPKQRDISFSSGPVSTVPNLCFGHPVLLLAANPSNNTAIVLIITSFGGSVDIHDKVRGRRHRLHDYLPIHPASHLADGTPSLLLCASQKLIRHCWVYIGTPYQCAATWLEGVWDENWLSSHPSRRLDSKSLHSLALYAVSLGLEQRIYKQLLRTHVILEPTQSRPMSIPIQYLPLSTNSMSSNLFGGRFNYRETIPQPIQHPVPSETTALLPRATRSRTIPHCGRVHVPKTQRKAWLLPLLFSITGIVFLAAILFGIAYLIRLELSWVIAVWRYTVWLDMAAIWQKLVSWMKAVLDVLRAFLKV